MIGDELIVTLSVDFAILTLQLYLFNKDVPIHIDIMITTFLAIFNFVSYLNGVIYIAGTNETKIDNSTVIITPIYKPNPFTPLFMIGFVITIVSASITLIKIFTSKRGSFELFS